MMDPEQRKQESITVLRELGVRVLDSLPPIESAAQTTLRPAQDVARRVLCLMLVSDVARHADLSECHTYLERNNLQQYLSPAERSFLGCQTPSEEEGVNLSWRCEAAYLLLWSLGKFESLPIPSSQVNLDDIYAHLPGFDDDAEQWVNGSSLIDKDSILDESDLIYRMHWATRQAQIEGKELDQLDGGVVQEWHHAVNWLTCYENLDWDEVTTDT